MYVTCREKRQSRRTGTLNLLLKWHSVNLLLYIQLWFNCLLQEGAPVDEEDDDDDEEEEKGKKGVS